MKPVCVPCARFYSPKKNGYLFIEGMPTHNGAPSGHASPRSWSPYKAWMGDMWECKGCGAQIVVGVGAAPVAEHYMPDFLQVIKNFGGSNLQVNDC